MADGSKVWQLCPVCKGSGLSPRRIAPEVEEACPQCSGEKYIFWGWMSKDDFELPADLPEP